MFHNRCTLASEYSVLAAKATWTVVAGLQGTYVIDRVLFSANPKCHKINQELLEILFSKVLINDDVVVDVHAYAMVRAKIGPANIN